MPTDGPYDRVRRDFEELEIEKQARFLIEASASTLARGLEEVGSLLADGLEDVLRRERGSRTRPESGPGPAEPETAQRQAPPNDAPSGD